MREYILCASMHLETLKDMIWFVNQHKFFPFTEDTGISVMRGTEENPEVIETFDAFITKHQLETIDIPCNKMAFGLDFSWELLYAINNPEVFDFNALLADSGVKKAFVFSSYESSPNFDKFVNLVMQNIDDATYDDAKEEILKYNDIIIHVLREYNIDPEVIDVMALLEGNNAPESASSEEYGKILAHIEEDPMTNWSDVVKNIPNVVNADIEKPYVDPEDDSVE